MAVHGSSIAHSNIALNRRFGTFSRLGGGRFAGYIEGNKTIIENNFYGGRYDFQGMAPVYQQPNIWDRASAFLKGFLDGLVGWLQNRPKPEVKEPDPQPDPKPTEIVTPKPTEVVTPKPTEKPSPEGVKTEYKGEVSATPATRTYTVNIQCKRRPDLEKTDPQGRKWYEAIPMQKFYEAYGLDTSWPKDKQKAFKEFIQNTILNGNNALVAGDHEVDPDKKYTFTYGGESIEIEFDEDFWAKQKPQPYCLGGNVRNANVHEKATDGKAKATITGTKDGKTTGTYTGEGKTKQEAIDNAKDDAKKKGVKEEDITNIEFSEN